MRYTHAQLYRKDQNYERAEWLRHDRMGGLLRPSGRQEGQRVRLGSRPGGDRTLAPNIQTVPLQIECLHLCTILTLRKTGAILRVLRRWGCWEWVALEGQVVIGNCWLGKSRQLVTFIKETVMCLPTQNTKPTNMYEINYRWRKVAPYPPFWHLEACM
jgi:hypothetical protein